MPVVRCSLKAQRQMDNRCGQLMKRQQTICKQEDTRNAKKRKKERAEVDSTMKKELSHELLSVGDSHRRSAAVGDKGEKESQAQKKARINAARVYAVGRAMVKLLRYKSEWLDLEEGQEGEHWVRVHKAIKEINYIVRKTIPGFNCTEEDIQNEVETSVHTYNGPRFELLISGAEKWVRATNVELYREKHQKQ